MNDPRIDELCRRIYKNHRRAIQLIYERVGSPAAGILAEVENLLRDDPRWHVFYTAGNHTDFVPSDWLGWLPRLGLDFADDPRSWFTLRMQIYGNQLDFYATINRIADLDLRRRIIKVLLDNGEILGFKRKGARSVKDAYTRVSSREHLLRWGEEDEPDPEDVRVAAKRKLDDLHPKLAAVRGLLEPLLAYREEQRS